MIRTLAAVLVTTALLCADNFTLKSNNLKGQMTHEQVFNGFGCSGKNISPQLSWSGAPEDTKSFAITLYDPDAPTGSGWWHWVIVNIPVSVTELARGAGNPEADKLPKGALQLMNNYGTVGFGGACPPKGDSAHRYIFTVYALDVDKLPIDVDTIPPIAGFNINHHTIAKASVMAYFGH